jgi:hypothetical protein
MVLRTSGTIVDVGQAFRSRFDDSESAASRDRAVTGVGGCGPASAGNVPLTRRRG